MYMYNSCLNKHTGTPINLNCSRFVMGSDCFFCCRKRTTQQKQWHRRCISHGCWLTSTYSCRESSTDLTSDRLSKKEYVPTVCKGYFWAWLQSQKVWKSLPTLFSMDSHLWGEHVPWQWLCPCLSPGLYNISWCNHVYAFIAPTNTFA